VEEDEIVLIFKLWNRRLSFSFLKLFSFLRHGNIVR
jgi:hypothetical protein